MAETADTPEAYIAADAPSNTESTLNRIADSLVNPEEAGEQHPGSRPGSQELRKERWDELVELFHSLKKEYEDDDHVAGLKMGYIHGIGDHPIGLAIALTHSVSPTLTATIPDRMLDLTKDGTLRLVDEKMSSTDPIRVIGFALPAIPAQ